MHALSYEVKNDPRSAVQPEWECHRGVLGKGVRGEWVPTGELRQDVGEGEGESTQVLLGRVGSQVDGELVLQLLEVKVERLVTPQSASL
jgi:hypothetical protein